MKNKKKKPREKRDLRACDEKGLLFCVVVLFHFSI